MGPIKPTTLHEHSPRRGIWLAVLAFTCWVLADSTIKLIGGSALPAYEIIAFMGLTLSAFFAVSAILRGGLKRLWPSQPWRQIVRSCLDLINNLCVVIALRHVPLTLFYILVFSAPMVVTVLASLFIHERIGMRRAVALCVGFTGVVIAVHPFGTKQPGDWIGYGACMICVACFSVNMVWSRVLTRTETSESLAFLSGMVMTIAGCFGMIFGAEPLNARLIVALSAMGIFCSLGSLSFFAALRQVSASTVSQYHYTQLVTGALVSYLIWRELPTLWMIMGGALIALSGLYIALLGSRLGSRPNPIAHQERI